MTNPLLLSFILVLTSSLEVLAQPQPHTLVAPILKHTDASTPLYSITLNRHEHYVIDVDAPFTWYHCQPDHHPPVGCGEPACTAVRSYLSPLCHDSNNTYRHGQCYCDDTPVNPVTGSCAMSQLTYKNFIISWTNGRFPTVLINFNHLFVSCAPPFLLQSLPKEVTGVGALSWSSLALPYVFAFPGIGIARKFGLCLPSSSHARGVIFFGDGPYYFLHPTDFDPTSVLSYTPLHGDQTSVGYFVNLTGMSINGKAIDVPRNAFDFNVSGSARLSSIAPYTTLRSDIYHTFLKEFKKATRGIAQVKNVKPFGLCFNTSTIGLSQHTLRIPNIDLVLGNGEKWTIYGSNSVKQVDNDVGCLAFVDGGKMAKQAVVIGTYQMENNFLLFDLEQSRLGFSSSLLRYRTSCGTFDLKVGG